VTALRRAIRPLRPICPGRRGPTLVRLRRPGLSGDRGSGTVLVVTLLGAVFTITAVLIPVLALLPASQAVQGAADAAALAAADTASGLATGVPCDTAARAAQLNGANLVACTVDGLIATVSVSRTIGVVTLGFRARAGPAP
jgi:secretion/DNA translocation related TadE-like protein